MSFRQFAVRDWIRDGKLRVDYLSTNDMLADAFNKPLNGSKLRQLCLQMGINFGSRNTAVAAAAKGSETVRR